MVPRPEVRIVDERRRLLERVFSREGAAEAPEDHRDPATGETVRMTPSQWALAEYDRRRSLPGEAEVVDPTASLPPKSDPSENARRSADNVEDASSAATEPSSGSTDSARRLRRSWPYLAVAGGLLLGAMVTATIEGPLRSAPQQRGSDDTSTVAAASGGILSAGSGEGDEGATLAAVSHYFASAPRAPELPSAVTQGFDATSFHQVAATVAMQESSAIYAARRLDDTYCLVSVTRDARAAETCGTMDDIARRGLTLTKDAVRDIDGRPITVTVIWQTDGTITWVDAPSVG